MSRIFWMGVGAAGGIYTYRKATRVAADVRERGVLRNVAGAARTASNLVASARYFNQLNQEPQVASEVVDIRSPGLRAG